MRIDSKNSLINELVGLMQNSILTKNQKLEIMELIDRQDKASENEKERFCLYYGLNINNRKNMTYNQITSLYGCSYNAVKYSILNMKRKLINYLEDQDIVIVKKIINECKKNNRNI